ncbi:MAG: TonB-dependent receptor plug domain-containing protein, partial [Bacteroidaceae bacterium]
MNNIFNHMFVHRALGAGLCVLMLSGLSIPSVYAQAEDGDTVTVRRIAKTKKVKKYPTKSVTGKVTDNATGEPMGGVRIQALGLEAYSTLTEEDGTYKLDIPEFSDAVYVYAEGYNPLQAAVKNGVADASLMTTQFNSYYTEGTSITSQRKTVLDETSSVSIDDDIERRLGGDIYTTKRNGLPGIGSYMTIRGINSLNANTQPIIIVDGNIIDTQYDRTTMHEGFYNNILLGLDPENVESVQVIKNATTLYGAKGANGAIVITTKRGKSMATKINVRVYGGVELTPKKLDVMGGDSYSAYLSDLVSTVKNNKNSSLDSYAFLDKSPSNYY